MHRRMCIALVALVSGCRDRAPSPPPDAGAAPPASASAAAKPRAVIDELDTPPPGPGWTRATPAPADRQTCSFFGKKPASGCDALAPIAAWTQGEHGRMRAFRHVDPATGAPLPLTQWRFYGKIEKLSDGRSVMEIVDQGKVTFWIVAGSLVLQAEDRYTNYGMLQIELAAWALRVTAVAG